MNKRKNTRRFSGGAKNKKEKLKQEENNVEVAEVGWRKSQGASPPTFKCVRGEREVAEVTRRRPA